MHHRTRGHATPATGWEGGHDVHEGGWCRGMEYVSCLAALIHMGVFSCNMIIVVWGCVHHDHVLILTYF